MVESTATVTAAAAATVTLKPEATMGAINYSLKTSAACCDCGSEHVLSDVLSIYHWWLLARTGPILRSFA